MPNLLFNGAVYGFTLVRHIDHVAAAIAAALAGADVDRRHAQIGAFADADAGIADDAPAVDQQAQKSSGAMFLKKWMLAGCVLFAKDADAFEVPSEPASTFGQNHKTGQAELRERHAGSRPIAAAPRSYSVVTGCCMTTT